LYGTEFDEIANAVAVGRVTALAAGVTIIARSARAPKKWLLTNEAECLRERGGEVVIGSLAAA